MPTAIVFARRYYSVKSLQENDRFIVACACLFLGAKCEEEMRALNDVCYQTYKSRQASLLDGCHVKLTSASIVHAATKSALQPQSRQ